MTPGEFKMEICIGDIVQASKEIQSSVFSDEPHVPKGEHGIVREYSGTATDLYRVDFGAEYGMRLVLRSDITV